MKIKIGQITKPVGLKGEVRVFSESEFKEDRFAKGRQIYLLIKDEYVKTTVISSSFSGNAGKVKLSLIDDIDQAERFRNVELFVDSESVKHLEEDEYYFFQLKGCDVYSQHQFLGKVKDVLDYPSSALLVIETAHKTFSLPFVKQFVLGVDLNLKRIDVHLIDGFL